MTNGNQPLRKRVLDEIEEEDIDFLRLPVHRHSGDCQERLRARPAGREAFTEGIYFDGSSIEGIRAHSGIGHAAQARSRHVRDPPVAKP